MRQEIYIIVLVERLKVKKNRNLEFRL